MFKCPTCGKEFSKYSSLRSHRETHSDVPHACDQCEKKYKRRGDLCQHKRTAHAAAGRFECDECGKICPHKKALNDHKRRVHSVQEFECPVCGKELRPGSSFNHMKTHADVLHACDQCEKKYKRRDSLLDHKRTAHAKAGRFECDECGKIFTHNTALRSHKRSHIDARNGKPHECDQCEKKYRRRTALLEHKRTAHAQPGRFECDECGKLCPHKRALNSHKRWVHSDREFECPVCGKKLRPGNASRHMKIHTGQQCRCDMCGKVCPNSVALAAHKHYYCPQRSEAKQSEASDLRKHLLVHDEKRAEYRCAQCPRSFKSRGNLGYHIRNVHSDSRFSCDSECGLQSATRSEYREHLKREHAAQHPSTCKCVSVKLNRAKQVATKLGNTAFLEADGTMKCTDGSCDFETTCARRMESHKEQCHHDAYQPALRCSSCQTWFTCPSTMKNHNAEKHEGERRFKCNICGYITNGKRNFTRHQTSCQQGKALGNMRLHRKKPMTENLDVNKESPRDVYHFGSKLGEGGFGRVYEAVKKSECPPVKYAIKEVGPQGGKSAELEAKCMRHFAHKNLMSLFEYYEWKEEGRITRFVVMEWCRPGSLTTMQKLVQFEEPHVLYVLKEVACGLEHLHSAGVIHRDLKSANVLVNERAEVKISDFGVSTDQRIAYNFRGTRGWVAPEVAAAALAGITGLKSAYTQKADVYSVGVLAIDCFLPRETLPTDFFHKKKVESESFAETQLQRIEDDRHIQLSVSFKRLVTRCLAPMTTRLSAAAVQKVLAVKRASAEPFKELVAECLKQISRKKEEKRSAHLRKPTTDTEESSLFFSPTPLCGLATTSASVTGSFTSPGGRQKQPLTPSSTSRLLSVPAERSQQATMSTGMSSLFSAAPARTDRGQPTANATAVSSLFSDSEANSQQASTSGGMSSLFFSTASSRTDH